MTLRVEVCRGVSCSAGHSKDILRDWELALGIKEGQTSSDGAITLCTQNCFGRCTVGPNLRVNENFYHWQSPGMARDILKSF
jgi:NADH:ubiquinone oxidoreductase subunit E